MLVVLLNVEIGPGFVFLGDAEHALGLPAACAGLAEVACEVLGQAGRERTQGG